MVKFEKLKKINNTQISRGTRPKYAIFINKYFQVGEDFSSLPEMIVILFFQNQEKIKTVLKVKMSQNKGGETRLKEKTQAFAVLILALSLIVERRYYDV